MNPMTPKALLAALLAAATLGSAALAKDPVAGPRPELRDPAQVNPGAITPSNAVPAPLPVAPTSSPLGQPAPMFQPQPRPEIQTPPSVTLPPTIHPVPLASGGPSYAGVVGVVRIELAKPKEMQTLLATWGLVIRTVSGDQRTVTVAAPAGTDLRTLLKTLRDDARVTSAELDSLGFMPPTQ